MNEKLIDKLDSPVTYIFLMVIAFSLFFYGMFLMSQASKISEYEQRGDYSWDIIALSENDSPVDFKEFRINYHFSEEDGTLSFKPKKHINKMIVIFPKSLKENISLRINKNSSWEPLQVNLPSHKQRENKATIIFNENNADEWIIIDFKMDLSPNAKFEIDKNSYWSTGEIYFTFKEEFECIRDDCVFNIWNLKKLNRGIPFVNSLRLQIMNQSKTKEDPLYIFQTSARSLKVLNTKSFKISIGASLMAGAIFALFSIFIGIIQYPRKKLKIRKNQKAVK